MEKNKLEKTQIEALASFYAAVNGSGVQNLAADWDKISNVGLWMCWQSAFINVQKHVFFAYQDHLEGRVDAREIVAAAACLDQASRVAWRAQCDAESARRAEARAAVKAARLAK